MADKRRLLNDGGIPFNNEVCYLTFVGIVREITGKQRNRVFAYECYLNILSEGTEVL